MSGSGIIGETTSFAAGKHHSKKPDLHKQIRLFCWSRIRESIYIFLRKIKERMPSSRHPAAVHRTAAWGWVRLLPLPRPNKNTTHMGGVFVWSRIRESNPPSRLGKPLYYRYTNPACSIDRGHYSRGKRKIQPFFVDEKFVFHFLKWMSLRGAKRRGNLPVGAFGIHRSGMNVPR